MKYLLNLEKCNYGNSDHLIVLYTEVSKGERKRTFPFGKFETIERQVHAYVKSIGVMNEEVKNKPKLKKRILGMVKDYEKSLEKAKDKQELKKELVEFLKTIEKDINNDK